MAGVDAGVAQPDQDVTLAGTPRADNRQIVLCANSFQTSKVVGGGLRNRRGGHVEALEGLDDRKRRGLEPVGVSQASRAAISASIMVRSTSSGVQRWVLATCSTSGTVRRTAASFSRRNPASGSGASSRDRLGSNGFRVRCRIGHEVCPSPGRVFFVGVQDRVGAGADPAPAHPRAGRGLWCADTGGEDGAHIGGAEPFERHRPV